MLDSLNPYKLTLNHEEGSYQFTTDYGIVYIIVFTDNSILIEHVTSLFDISIYPEPITLPINNNGRKYKPKDKRVSDTISTFLLKFFTDNNNNCVSFTCESVDLKQNARNILFNNWYKRLKKEVDFVEKHDFSVNIEDTQTYMIGSVLIHSSNSSKELVLDKISDIINYK